MGERNVVQKEQLWKQRLDTEVQVAATWQENWGFLGDRPVPPVRGFSKNTVKYAGGGGGKYTVSSVRVADETAEGLAAAAAEQKQRQERSALTWQTPFPTPVKPVGIEKGPFKVRNCAPTATHRPSPRPALLLS